MTMQNRRQQGRCRRACMDVFTASSASSCRLLNALAVVLINLCNSLALTSAAGEQLDPVYHRYVCFRLQVQKATDVRRCNQFGMFFLQAIELVGA